MEYKNVSPPPEALTERPLTVAELDTHPVRVRIWATILHLMRDEDEIEQRAFNEGYKIGYDDARSKFLTGGDG